MEFGAETTLMTDDILHLICWVIKPISHLNPLWRISELNLSDDLLSGVGCSIPLYVTIICAI